MNRNMHMCSLFGWLKRRRLTKYASEFANLDNAIAFVQIAHVAARTSTVEAVTWSMRDDHQASRQSFLRPFDPKRRRRAERPSVLRCTEIPTTEYERSEAKVFSVHQMGGVKSTVKDPVRFRIISVTPRLMETTIQTVLPVVPSRLSEADQAKLEYTNSLLMDALGSDALG